MNSRAQPEVAAVRPDDRAAALTLALQQVPEAPRATRIANALALVASGDIDPRGIFVAKEGDQLVGVQVCIPLQGASGLFWLPQVVDSWQQTDLADRLVSTAVNWIQFRGAKLGQALVHSDDLVRTRPLVRGGFRHVTQLQYLCHDLEEVPPVEPRPLLQLEAYTDANAETFHATLLRTYEGTLDCPELNGVRNVDEIMAGHRSQGIWHPETWWLVRINGAPAGIVMLTELFERDGWDLTYLGLTEEFRGHGWGRAMTEHALNTLRNRDAPRLLVAVDARNKPALHLYESMGFARTEAREVLLCLFSQHVS